MPSNACTWICLMCASVAASPSSTGCSRDLEVYWNVPSFMCRKYGIEFPRLSESLGIVQNQLDEFVGDKIAILYDPGAFPAFLQADNESILVRNGGVPQEGDLKLHHRRLRESLDELLPEAANFSGLAVLDMESWRPVFRQNWASLQIYRNYSLELERRRHPFWPTSKLREEAARRFERSARDFMESSLALARRLRPRARWGYYAYPYCFNWSANQQASQCSAQVKRENDQMSWLFGAGADVLYPSVYLQRKLSPEQRLGLVRGRVQEALRLARANSSRPKVFVYYWFKYQDQRDTYVDKADLVATVTEVARRGADGLVIWGSSNDLNTRDKCNGLTAYLRNVLAPALRRVRQRLDDQCSN